MIEDEEKMVYYKYFIKKGYNPEEAEELAKKDYERDMAMLKRMDITAARYKASQMISSKSSNDN